MLIKNDEILTESTLVEEYVKFAVEYSDDVTINTLIAYSYYIFICKKRGLCVNRPKEINDILENLQMQKNSLFSVVNHYN